MPEGKCVTGVEATVRELGHGRERETAELGELADARQVEEPVAADLAGDVPEEQSEHGTGDPDRGAPG